MVESGVSIVRGSLGSDAHGENSCGACDLFLVSSAALLTHHMHRRNYVNPFRKLVSSSVCHSCGLDFHTLKRAFTHVAYASKKCSQYYVDFVPPMSDVQHEACTVRAVKEVRKQSCKVLLKPPMPVVAIDCEHS